MRKALALLSGGLDSALAALLIKEQGVDVIGLAFKSLFFEPEFAQKQAKELDIPLKVVDFSKEHLAIVKKPCFGYGKRMNPCIDCHLLMLKKAKKLMVKDGYDFIITGDVLGQRGFSQNKRALALIEKEAGLEGLIVRPLSAKLLDETIAEKKGWVDRKKLFSIQGKSRKKQLELAKKYQLKSYSTPGTSCLLTDPSFSERLRLMLDNYPDASADDIKLLRLGRHFWHQFPRSRIENDSRSWSVIVVGRNEKENNQLEKLAKKEDVVLDLKDIPSPIVLIRSFEKKINDKAIEHAKKLLKKYAHIKSAANCTISHC
jgi:tRNA U34 2-thiouridine synthase MnmA/TrmU